jgi:hypothetical protein
MKRVSDPPANGSAVKTEETRELTVFAGPVSVSDLLQYPSIRPSPVVHFVDGLDVILDALRVQRNPIELKYTLMKLFLSLVDVFQHGVAIRSEHGDKNASHQRCGY